MELIESYSNLKRKSNCFTIVYNYLLVKYNIPKSWGGYTNEDMDKFVSLEKRFLAKKKHYLFFESFCHEVNSADKDDVVITKCSVGVAINKFTYWVWSEDKGRVIHKKIDKDCLLLRMNNG